MDVLEEIKRFEKNDGVFIQPKPTQEELEHYSKIKNDTRELMLELRNGEISKPFNFPRWDPFANPQFRKRKHFLYRKFGGENVIYRTCRAVFGDTLDYTLKGDWDIIDQLSSDLLTYDTFKSEFDFNKSSPFGGPISIAYLIPSPIHSYFPLTPRQFKEYEEYKCGVNIWIYLRGVRSFKDFKNMRLCFEIGSETNFFRIGKSAYPRKYYWSLKDSPIPRLSGTLNEFLTKANHHND